jgi:ABC-type branched-subunit amino acid transport system substrate-binding protein
MGDHISERDITGKRLTRRSLLKASAKAGVGAVGLAFVGSGQHERLVGGASPSTAHAQVPPGASRTVNLSPGWNLVGWTGAGSTPVADALAGFDGAFSTLFTWDAASQSFLNFNPSVPPALNTLSDLAFGDGVWINVSSATEATWQQPAFTGNRSVALRPGFNLVMWTGPSGTPVSTAVTGLGSALRTLFTYDATGQQFRSFSPTLPPAVNTASELNYGDGVWIDVSQAVVWAQMSAAEPLALGFLADFSGPLAQFGPVIQSGVELALKHVNDAGGVLGQDVTLVTGDTALDSTQGVEEARRLVDIEGVHGIIGPLSSVVTLAVTSSVTADAGVPTISPSATSPALSGTDDNGFLFRTSISDANQGVILAQLAADEGIGNVGVLFINDAYGQGLSEAFESAFDGTITSSPYNAGASSYLPELENVAEGGADVLVAIGFPAQASIFLREALDNAIFSQFLFVDGTKSQALIDEFGDALNGSKGTAPSAGPESDATRVWNAAYVVEFGALPSLPFVREAYDATIALALAAEYAGSTDGAAIRDALPKVTGQGGQRFIPGPNDIASALGALRSGSDINYDGAATLLDWDANGDISSGFIEIWQYQNGTIVNVRVVAFPL